MSTVKLGSLVELNGPPWLVLSAVIVLAGAAVTMAYLEHGSASASARADRD